ncbi:MAG: hypothetical protein ACRDZ8_14630 [Acidimicrobiales bacterium]
MGARWPRALAAMLLVAGAGSVGALVLLAAPASATATSAPCGGQLQLPCPPMAQVSATSSEMSGTITITWTPSKSVDTVTPGPANLAWQPQASGAPADPAPIPTQSASLEGCSPGNLGQPVVCTYSWPSSLLNNGYVLNGQYAVTTSAKECLIVVGCSTVSSVTQTIGVENPAVAPTGVKAALVPGSNPEAIQVSWTPNPEPDIVGYVVYSGTSTTPFCQVNSSPANPLSYSCQGIPTKNGNYSFHVVAYRYGNTFNDQVAKQVAGASSANTPNVSVTGITAPVTTLPVTNTLGNIGVVTGPAKNGTTSGAGRTSGTVILAVPSVASTTTTTLGGDFSPVLPYGTTTSTSSTVDPSALSVPTKHKGSSVATIAAVGAGLLVATIALHGVWLRSEVRRSGQLEPLDPESYSRH